MFKSILADTIDDGLLAPARILTLAALIDPPYRAMVLLAAGCGLRWSEAAGLTRDRIHLGARACVIIDRQLAFRPATTHRGQAANSRPLFARRKLRRPAGSSRYPPP